MISDFHFSEALFMAKAALEPCTTLDVAGVCLWKSFISLAPFGLSTNLMKG